MYKWYLKICFSIIKKNIVLKMFWYVLLICKGSLTSLLHIDSCWVYLILRSLTTLLYAIHVCRGSFTSPLMHCIICIMWVRACHPFCLSSLLHVMHVCREVNLASSSSWMYIAYILIIDNPFIDSLFRTKRGRRICLFYFNPFVDDWQKGGEVFVFICI